ncbi:MAG: NUDIX domain-containing protein [Flavisolibacter sp.]
MRKSAGILLYRKKEKQIQVFLVHPGGPFWKNKDSGAWSIPKGEFNDDEKPLTAARREFEEETGKKISGDFIELIPIKQKAGKMVYAWAVEGDINADEIVSNIFKVEWPYKSGKWQSFPEVDKAGWFTLGEANEKINPAQAAWLVDLESRLNDT